jgi:hypothetical protein
MLVADIAWLFIAGSAATTAAVRSILNAAKSGFAPRSNSDSDIRDAFDGAATLPDFLKTNLHTAYQPLADRLNTSLWPGGVIDPRVSPRERVQCKTWHYYDTPINFAGPQPAVFPSNLEVAYRTAVSRLADLHSGQNNDPLTAGFDPDDLRFWWFGWVLHLAGDAHQPLHCTSNYASNPNGDEGGNLFKLSGHHNLHSFWDGALIDAAVSDGSDVGTIENEFDPSAKLSMVSNAWQDLDISRNPNIANVVDWVSEGAQIGKSTAYTGVTQGAPISNAYRSTAQAICKEAGIVAGRRLANALISIFEP